MFYVLKFSYVRDLNLNWHFGLGLFDPYGSNKPSPKCQFENGKFKLRSLINDACKGSMHWDIKDTGYALCKYSSSGYFGR